MLWRQNERHNCECLNHSRTNPISKEPQVQTELFNNSRGNPLIDFLLLLPILEAGILMTAYCPKCFLDKEVQSLERLGYKLVCPLCQTKFSMDQTLVSEDSIRLLVYLSKGKLNHLLKRLK